MQAGAEARYADMDTHLQALTVSMTPPPARRPGARLHSHLVFVAFPVCCVHMFRMLMVLTGICPALYAMHEDRQLLQSCCSRMQPQGNWICCMSSGAADGEAEAGWVMAVTWAVADALLLRGPTCCERAALLYRLTAVDLPVPGGSGAARYGCVIQSSPFAAAGLLSPGLTELAQTGYVAWPGKGCSGCAEAGKLHQQVLLLVGLSDKEGHVRSDALLIVGNVDTPTCSILYSDSTAVIAGQSSSTNLSYMATCRLVALLYELRGMHADGLARWPAKSTYTTDAPAYVDANAALQHLLSHQDWDGARRCLP